MFIHNFWGTNMPTNMPYVGLWNLIIKRGTIRDITSGLYWHVGSDFGPPILKRGIKIIKKFLKSPYCCMLKKKDFSLETQELRGGWLPSSSIRIVFARRILINWSSCTSKISEEMGFSWRRSDFNEYEKEFLDHQSWETFEWLLKERWISDCQLSMTM